MRKRRGRDSDAWREAARPVFSQLLELADVLNTVQDAIEPEARAMRDLDTVNAALAAVMPADNAFREALSSWASDYAPGTGQGMASFGFAALDGTFKDAYTALILAYLAFLGTTRYSRQVELDDKLEEVEACFGPAVEWYNAAADLGHRIIATGRTGNDSQLEAYRNLSLQGTLLNNEFHDYLDGLAPR